MCLKIRRTRTKNKNREGNYVGSHNSNKTCQPE